VHLLQICAHFWQQNFVQDIIMLDCSCAVHASPAEKMVSCIISLVKTTEFCGSSVSDVTMSVTLRCRALLHPHHRSSTFRQPGSGHGMLYSNMLSNNIRQVFADVPHAKLPCYTNATGGYTTT
jgi:hypothetical protein